MAMTTQLFVLLLFLTSIAFSDDFATPTGFEGPEGTRLGSLYGTNQLYSTVKDPKELDDYFLKQLASDNKAIKRYTNFKAKEYKNILFAAQTIGVPVAMMECMIFLESKFDNSVDSATGAKYNIQMMPKKFENIKDNLVWAENSIRQEKEFNELMNEKNFYEITEEDNLHDNQFVRCAQIENGEGPYYEHAVDKKAEKAYCEDFKDKFEYRTKLYYEYQNYLARMHITLKNKPQYFPSSKPGQFLSSKDIIPSGGEESMGSNPVIKIGFMAMALKEMMYRMDYQFPKNNSIQKTSDPIGYLLLAAGGYNSGGQESFLDVIKNNNTLDQMCKGVAALGGNETGRYMISLRRCMTKGNMQPPDQNKKKDLTADDKMEMCSRVKITATTNTDNQLPLVPVAK